PAVTAAPSTVARAVSVTVLTANDAPATPTPRYDPTPRPTVRAPASALTWASSSAFTRRSPPALTAAPPLRRASVVSLTVLIEPAPTPANDSPTDPPAVPASVP